MLGEKVLEMQWLDSLDEKFVRYWLVLHHNFGNCLLSLTRQSRVILPTFSQGHTPKPEMSNLECALTGFMTLFVLRSRASGYYSEQPADACTKSALASKFTSSKHDGGCCGNHQGLVEKDLADESYEPVETVSTQGVIKAREYKLMFELSKLPSLKKMLPFKVLFKLDPTDVKSDQWFGEINHPKYRLRKYTGLWAKVHIAMDKKSMSLNCWGNRFKVRSVN
jgi:hypothetical protein